MMKKSVTLLLLGFAVNLAQAADAPTAEIRSDQIKATLYLPDVKQGYYRSTRFDWSGIISSLEYKGHNFYGPWFQKIDPKVTDFTNDGPEVVVSPNSSVMGPAEEFSPQGYDDAKLGETFIKIGVGVLRKPDAGRYDHYKAYEIVDSGKWTVKKTSDSVETTQELTDPATHFGYTYRKVIRLIQGKPQMVMEHSLKNTGTKPIQGTVYNHNFLVLDKQGPGPGVSLTFPFQLTSQRPPNKELGEIKGNQILYTKTLEGKDTMSTNVRGFSDSAKDFDIRVENSKIGAGYRVTGDRPVTNLGLWSIRTNVSIEPFVAIKIDPGSEFTWKLTYDYYTLPAK